MTALTIPLACGCAHPAECTCEGLSDMPTGARLVRRKHPRAKVGDVFGPWTVVSLADTDYTSNERVRVRCGRGHERVAYVFNLRKAKRCPQCMRGET